MLKNHFILSRALSRQANCFAGRRQHPCPALLPDRLPSLGNLATPNRWCTSLLASRGCEMELAMFTVLTPFPGTALYERLDREGRILSRNWDAYTMDRCVFQPRHFSPEELTAQVNRAERDFFSLRSIYRRSQFKMRYNYLEKYLAVNVLRNIGLKFSAGR
jgi:hypothetical protein